MTLKKSQLSTLIDSLKIQIQLMHQSKTQDWSFIEQTLQSFDLSDDQRAKIYQSLEIPEAIQDYILTENTHFLIQRAIEFSAQFQIKEAIDSLSSYFQKKEIIAPLKNDEAATELYLNLLFETRQLDVIAQVLKKQEKQYAKLSNFAQNQFHFNQIRFWIECENIKQAEKKFKFFEKTSFDQSQILILKMLIAEKKYDVLTHQACFLALVENQTIDANSPYLRHISCLEENGACALDTWQFFYTHFSSNNASNTSPYYQLTSIKINEKLGDLSRCDEAISTLVLKYPDHAEIQKYHLLLQYKKENFDEISGLIDREQSIIYRIMADEKVDPLEIMSVFDSEKLQILILYFAKTKNANLLEAALKLFDVFGSSSAKTCHYRALCEHYLTDYRETHLYYEKAFQEFEAHLKNLTHPFYLRYLLQYFEGTLTDLEQLAKENPNHFTIQAFFSHTLILNTDLTSTRLNLTWLDDQLSNALKRHEEESLSIPPILIELKFHQLLLSSQLEAAFDFYLQINALHTQPQHIPFHFTQASQVLSLINYVIEADELKGGHQHLEILKRLYTQLSPNLRLRAKINIKYANLFALIQEDELALSYLQKAQTFVAAHLLETQVLIWACATCDLLDELDLLAYWTKELIYRGNRPETHYYAALTLWHVESEEAAYHAAQRAIEEDRQYFLPYLVLAKYELLIEKNEQKALNYIKAFKRATHAPNIRKKEAMVVEWMATIRMGDEKKADRLMKKLIEAGIDQPLEIYHLRAQVYQDLGKSETLIDFFTKIKSPLNAESYLYLAKAYDRLNLKDQSKDYYLRAIDHAPEDSTQKIDHMSHYARFLAQHEMWIEADHLYLKIYQNYLEMKSPNMHVLRLALQYPRFQSIQGNVLLRDLSYEEILKLNHDNEDGLIALFDHWLNLLIEAEEYEEVKEKVEFFQTQYFHFESLAKHLLGFLGASYYGLKSFVEAKDIFENLYLDEFYLFNDYYFKSLRLLDEKDLFYALLHQQIEIFPKEYQLRKWILEALFEDESFDTVDEHLEVIKKYHLAEWEEDHWEEKIAKIRQYQ